MWLGCTLQKPLHLAAYSPRTSVKIIKPLSRPTTVQTLSGEHGNLRASACIQTGSKEHEGAHWTIAWCCDR